jgi:2-iminobutanoate/2-iminopropanoate deaminase
MVCLRIVLLTLTVASCAGAPRPVAVLSREAPAPVGPYSQAVDTGDLVFVAGQIALDPATGQLAGADVPTQTERLLANLRAVLAAAGLGLDDVVRTTVYMVDLGQFAAMNKVYARHFTGVPPARATVQVAALPKGALVEIDAIAVRRRHAAPSATSRAAAPTIASASRP